MVLFEICWTAKGSALSFAFKWRILGKASFTEIRAYDFLRSLLRCLFSYALRAALMSPEEAFSVVFISDFVSIG